MFFFILDTTCGDGEDRVKKIQRKERKKEIVLEETDEQLRKLGKLVEKEKKK